MDMIFSLRQVQEKCLEQNMPLYVVFINFSKAFDTVSTGVKQGCVLAPTLFSLYLVAMLEVAFRSTEEGVYIQIQHNVDLFNMSHFKAKTKTDGIVVQEILFAEDSAIMAHTAEGTKALVDRF